MPDQPRARRRRAGPLARLDRIPVWLARGRRDQL